VIKKAIDLGREAERKKDEKPLELHPPVQEHKQEHTKP